MYWHLLQISTDITELSIIWNLVNIWFFHGLLELRINLTLVWTCKIILDLILLKIQRYDFIVEETYTTMSKHSQIRYVTKLSLLWNLENIWFSHGLLELRKIFDLRKYLTLVWTCKIIFDLILLKIQRYDFIVEETYTTMSELNCFIFH